LTGRITIKKLKVKVTRFFSEKTGKRRTLQLRRKKPRNGCNK